MNATQVSAACAAVVRRLMLAHWSALLSRSSAITFGVLLVVAAVWAWFSGKPPGLLTAVACIALWLLLTAAWAWFRRPAPTKALAIWDERSARHEMFVSAYCFEQLPQRSPGEEMHLARAHAVLNEELPKLRRQVPIVWQHRAWLAPLALIIVLQIVSYWPGHSTAESVDPAAQQRAAEVAASLEEKIRNLDPLPGLDEAERKQVDSLQQSVQEAAEKMKDLEDSTPREALSELEERARTAEKLAEALGASDAGKLSAEMLAEMDRHADTADLAAALRADDAEKIASEATKLAEKLDQKDMSLEERQRIAEAFKKSMEAAQEKDRQNPAGKHIAEANKGLQKKKPAEASKEMRDLAKSMNRQLQRKQSARQLQQLAKNLRSAGQQIFGRQNAGLQRLAQNPNNQNGLQRAGTPKQIPLGQLMPNQPSNPGPGQQTPGQPGAAQAQAQPGGKHGAMPAAGGQGNPQQAMVPVPGAGNPGQPNAGQMAAGAGQQPGSGAIPIPGTSPGGSPSPGGQSPGAGQGQTPGSGQSPGAGQTAGANGQPGGSGASSAGGLQAGSGSAAMGNAPTKPMEAKQKGIVKAQVGKEGPSQARAVDPREHTEQAQQEARKLAVDFIKVQEEALADEPLPVSRREQVRRYFNSLRKQLSTSEPSSEPKP